MTLRWKSAAPGALLPALLFFPCAADAHSPIEGLGSFYNGLLHPLVVPVHLLPLLALGLLIGQQGALKTPSILFAYLAALVCGLMVSAFSASAFLPDFFPETWPEPALLGIAAATGLFLAAHPRIPSRWVAVLCVTTGLLVGADSTQGSAPDADRLGGLIGSGISAYLLPLYPAALVERFNARPWQRIGARVIGSWIAASAVLVLSLSLFAARS